MADKVSPPQRERRNLVLDQVRTQRNEGKPTTLVGHAAVFDTPYRVYWFSERVARGAFADSIKNDDIRALFNHDDNIVLGRNKAGTLRLSEDDKGLAVEIDLPDTQAARDLAVSIERGDISQMSIGFNVVAEKWEHAQEAGQEDQRTLEKLTLFDVSPVTFPASPTTDIAKRSHDAWLETERKGRVLHAAPVSTLRARLNTLKASM